MYRYSDKQRLLYLGRVITVARDNRRRHILVVLFLPAALHKRKPPVFNLLRGRFWGFAPCSGDTLHWCGWNCQISPPSVQRLGYWTPKLKFLLRFDQNVEYKCRAGAYPLRDSHKICRVCTLFQDSLAVKISLNLLKGLRSYGGFKLRGFGYTKIFSAP